MLYASYKTNSLASFFIIGYIRIAYFSNSGSDYCLEDLKFWDYLIYDAFISSQNTMGEMCPPHTICTKTQQ